ncbi:MAG: endonuclease/exonuclease/phosphatase [Chloroflexi bacterium]|nr:endonuclease/exonuclease/phosphatase [Chloroflexota bacterium]
MAKQFTSKEWEKVRARMGETNQARYGLPTRRDGSVLLGSFNVRKLGAASGRSDETWAFLADACRRFDLLAVQEVMDDLSGLRELKERMGPEFALVVSDQTGVFPGERGLGERLGFIYRWDTVERMEMASDISYDRTKLIDSIARNWDTLSEDMGEYPQDLAAYEEGALRRKPKAPRPSFFLSFIRQPYCVAFRIAGSEGAKPYEFMAVNAHLLFGESLTDRRLEFEALIEWLMSRLEDDTEAYYPDLILMGDLNLDYDNPARDRPRIERFIKELNEKLEEGPSVNFPFLDPHPDSGGDVFRTNARKNQTFDQIALFIHDPRLPTYEANITTMGAQPEGPDYGVFDFVSLFSEALHDLPYDSLTDDQRDALFEKFEHDVSDHMPLWLRLPLPTA